MKMKAFRHGNSVTYDRATYVILRESEVPGFAGRKTLICSRVKGRKIYVITQYEHGTFSKPVVDPFQSAARFK